MSKFGADTVRKVAELARLQLTEAEVTKFTEQVGHILAYVEKLDALDTAQVAPLLSPLEVVPPLRADDLRPSPGAEVMVSLAKEHLYESYKVPQVMGAH
ncbi:MAG: Asp-tRNA(Asn)/Glu-tRNA(Gln) amidotransferase subunit GatC [Deltaproteobacteria bacterium]|nr:Asp-tRNA(Asn)/Glu-tRNA(Gln) amidotransferase subunit GatC [Deltaproteobacteria bacterium]